MRGISWLAERTLSFLRRTLLHGVSQCCVGFLYSKVLSVVICWFHTVATCRCCFSGLWRRVDISVSEKHVYISRKDGKSMFLRNAGIYLLVHMASQPRTASKFPPPREPQLSQGSKLIIFNCLNWLWCMFVPFFFTWTLICLRILKCICTHNPSWRLI
jgi:hypothetical protein